MVNTDTGTGTGTGGGPDVPAVPDTSHPQTGTISGNSDHVHDGSCCHGAHNFSVHQALDGGGGEGGAPAPKITTEIEPNIWVDLEGLMAAGHGIYLAGDSIKQRVQAALDRITSLESSNPAGDDDAGKGFHKNYDESAALLRTAVPGLAEGIKGLGVFAEEATIAYANFDDSAAEATRKVVGL